MDVLKKVILHYGFIIFLVGSSDGNAAYLSSPLKDDAQLFNRHKTYEVVDGISLLEFANGVCLKVYTVPSLHGNSIEAISSGFFKEYRLNSKRKCGVILLVVAMNDQQAYLKIGDSLSPLISQQKADAWLKNAVLPHLQKQKPIDAVFALMDLIRGVAPLTDEARAIDVQSAPLEPQAQVESPKVVTAPAVNPVSDPIPSQLSWPSFEFLIVLLISIPYIFGLVWRTQDVISEAKQYPAVLGERTLAEVIRICWYLRISLIVVVVFGTLSVKYKIPFGRYFAVGAIFLLRAYFLNYLKRCSADLVTVSSRTDDYAEAGAITCSAGGFIEGGASSIEAEGFEGGGGSSGGGGASSGWD